jgi:outer membrane protein assembly factor BamB
MENRGATAPSIQQRTAIASEVLAWQMLGAFVCTLVLSLIALAVFAAWPKPGQRIAAMSEGAVSGAMTAGFVACLWAAALRGAASAARRRGLINPVTPDLVALTSIGGLSTAVVWASRHAVYPRTFGELTLIVLASWWTAAFVGTLPGHISVPQRVWQAAFVATLAVAAWQGYRAVQPRIDPERAAAQREKAIDAPPLERWSIHIDQLSGVVAVSTDGTLYVDEGRGALHARGASDGHDRWVFDSNDIYSTFSGGCIDGDGTLFTVHNRRLYSLAPDGRKQWEYDPGENAIIEVLGLDADGAVLLGVTSTAVGVRSTVANSVIRAIDHGGAEQWAVSGVSWSRPDLGTSNGAVAIDADGTIIARGDRSLIAMDARGNKRWERKVRDSLTAPAIGETGVLYASGNLGLWAFAKTGEEKWFVNTRPYAGTAWYSTPVVSADGTIYFATDSLWAVRPDGTVKWKWTGEKYLDHSPVLAADGTIVVSDAGGRLYGITSDGRRRWQYARPMQPHYGPPPISFFTMAPASLALVHMGDIVSLQSMGGLMNSAWPTDRHDPQNTGRARRHAEQSQITQ